MGAGLSAGVGKKAVSTGNSQADLILNRVRSIPTASEMSMRFYQMHRTFSAVSTAEDVQDKDSNDAPTANKSVINVVDDGKVQSRGS